MSADAGKNSNSMGQMLGIVGGLVAGRYFGIQLLFPGIGWALGAFLFGKLGPERSKPFSGALAVQMGQFVWFISAIVILPDLWGAVAFDVVLLAVGILWLLLAPGLVSVIFLTVYQTVVLAINVVSVMGMGGGGEQFKPLLLHIWQPFGT